MEEKLVKRLLTSIKCSSCGQSYEVGNIDVLGHNQDMWFLRVRCSSCHTECLVAATIKENQIPEAVTDLIKTELKRFANVTIEANDVLDMHNFLKDFKGNFSSLFGQK